MRTPAAEAMEALDRVQQISGPPYMLAYDFINGWDKGTRIEHPGYGAVVREALLLLAAAQSGKAKVLEREPTEKMISDGVTQVHSYGRVSNGVCNAFRKMFDAAESYAAPSAAEVGDE